MVSVELRQNTNKNSLKNYKFSMCLEMIENNMSGSTKIDTNREEVNAS